MLLEIRNITKIYNKGTETFTALDGVNIEINQGDFISVVGPSGSGKSTLLHTVGGLIHPDSGEVLFKGKDIYKMSASDSAAFRKKHVSFVFQLFHLIPYLTVYENIKLGIAGSELPGEIDSLLIKCILDKQKKKYPSELSVGERQRTAFIRAIISRPDILLADEPTGNLDEENSSVIFSLISDFNKEGGTVLIVSHDPSVSKISARNIKLRSGRLV